MFLNRAPIRLRLTLWYVILLAVTLAAFSAGVYLLLRHALYQNLDDSLQSRAGALLSAVQYEGARPVLPGQIPSGDPDQDERFARTFDASGGLSFEDNPALGPVPVDPRALAIALGGRSTTRSIRIGEDAGPMRVETLPIIRGGAIVGALEVGQSEEDVSDTLTSLLLLLGLAYPLTLAVASLGGVFLAGRALSPIDNITRAARHISAEDLTQRLNLRLPDDEVGRLASTFDGMIARLDDAFRRQRQFTADASHELRTPLTIIKGQIDVSLQKERGPEAYRQVLRAVNEEVDRLIRLAGSLLTLTRADAGQIPLTFESVNIGEIVAGVSEQVRPAATARGVELRVHAGPSVIAQADEDLLLQLMLNLLDNAIKYAPPGGQVTVGCAMNGNRAELWVQDNGIGIPSEHIPRIFDRFYRVDKARSRAEGGVGLGLAICRWIVEAHGGSIHVESVPGNGSTFTVLLPAQR
jgi:heavy metal sensor kinase